VEDIIDSGRGIKAVYVRINDFYDYIFSIFIIELLTRPVYIDILQIKLYLVAYAEAYRWLPILIREFLLLFLSYSYYCLYLVSYLA